MDILVEIAQGHVLNVVYSRSRRPQQTSEEEHASELALEWMDPGPWPLQFSVEISGAYSTLHPTSMNKKGNITVCHTLKIIIWVEEGISGVVQHCRSVPHSFTLGLHFHRTLLLIG